MARKIKKKVRRKDLLKETDEFITFSEQMTEWGAENWPLLLIGSAVVVVLIVVGIMIRSGIEGSQERKQAQLMEAITTFDSSLQKDIFPQTPEGLPMDIEGQKKFTDAAYKFEKFLREYPDTAQAPLVTFYMANCELRDKNYAGAREYFQKVVQLEGKGGGLLELAKYNIGMCDFLEGKYAEAFGVFNEMKAEDTPTGRVGSLVYGGRCLEELGRVDEAIEYYQLAVDAYSDSELTKGLDTHIEKLKLQSANKSEGNAPDPDAPSPEVPD